MTDDRARRVGRAVGDEPVEPVGQAVELGDSFEPAVDADRHPGQRVDERRGVEPVQPSLRGGGHLHQLPVQLARGDEQLAWADAADQRPAR